MGDSIINEHLAGTERIIKSEGHEATLIPQPTASPNDPLNWSPWRKYWHAFLVLFIVGLTAATSNDAGSASDAMLDMGISENIENIGAGVLFAGIGYTTFLLSPLPALYGRRSTYLICLLSSIIGSVWFAKSRHATDAIWSQLFVGASESCAEAAAQLSLSELFYSHQRGMVLGLYILATSIGTFLGPLFAGLIADDDRIGWSWIGWFAVIISVVTLIVFLFAFEETTFNRRAVLEGVRVMSSNAETDNKKEDWSRNESEPQAVEAASNMVDKPKTYWQRIALVTPSPLLKGIGFKQYFQMLFQTLRVFSFPAVLYAGLQWGAQDAWLTFYLTVQEDNYYDDPWDYGDTAVALMNIPTLIGALIGCVYGGWFSDRFVEWKARKRGGISEAEDRLLLMYPAAIINPAGLMLFGIGSGKGWLFPKLWAAYVGLGFIGFGWGCAGDIALSYLADCYPDMILEGMVGVAVINNSIALIFTFCTGIWMDTQSLSQVFIAIGVLSFFFFMTTLPMHYWGKAARRKTAGMYNRFILSRDGQ
ncbi:membrane transporter [Mariannaea sp. PMI_226]|nr:membrane transporter [Mariannaea sp. PMI_226]